MHKSGHFLKRLNGTTMKDRKQSQLTDKIDKLKRKYKHVDKELEVLRKMKADRIKRFHMERQGSAFSAVNRSASYSAIEGHYPMDDELEKAGTVKINISTDYD